MPRLLLRPFLGVAVALCGCGGQEAVAPPPDRFIQVQVRDASGAPATAADVRVSPYGNEHPPAQWDEVGALLSVPRAGAPHSVRIGLAGHLLEWIEGLAESRTVSLRRGPVMRVSVLAESAPPPPLLVLLRVRPLAGSFDLGDEILEDDLATLSPLLESVGEEMEPMVAALPRGPWGLAITPETAQEGIRVPLPGSYEVFWGVLDPERGLWFTTQGQGEQVRVGGDGGEPELRLRVTATDLDAAVRGLASTPLPLPEEPAKR